MQWNCSEMYIREKKQKGEVGMIKLKPCPFCGEEFAVVSKISDGCLKKYQIVCDDSSMRKCACEGVYVYGCGGSTGYYETRAEAIDAWNTRANDSLQREDGEVG